MKFFATSGVLPLLFLMLSFNTEVNAQLYSANPRPITGDKVGVDTNSPTTSLDVRTMSTNTDPFIVHRGYSTGRPGGLLEFHQDVSFVVRNNKRIGLHTDNPQYNFHLKGHGFVAYNFFVNGKLGVGTTQPTHKLHVHGNSKLVGFVETGALGVNSPANPNFSLDVYGRSRFNGNSEFEHNVFVEGNLTIKGTSGNTEIKLYENGKIRCREVKVDLAAIPDYVFYEDYNLMPLNELRVFIKENKHLPNVKSEAEYNKEGSIDLAEMNLILLEKVEELTLYILQLEERINNIEK